MEVLVFLHSSSGRSLMELALFESITQWQQLHPQEFAINWVDISNLMNDKNYEINSLFCLKLWMRLAYGLDELITHSEEVEISFSSSLDKLGYVMFKN